jgi:ribosomal protein S18 acetylase RimI-like enzyme
MDYEIRRGNRDDVEQLGPLWQALRSHHATLPAMRPVRSREESWSHRRRQYLEWLSGDHHTLLLAERGGEPIGYAVVSIADSPVATWDVGERTAEMETLSVLESERGTGVGRALTESAVKVAAEAGAETMFVGVAHSNADAIRFYDRQGFEPFYVTMMINP